MKLNYRKTVFLAIIALAISCADEENVKPNSPSIENENDEIIVYEDSDFISENDEENGRLEQTIKVRYITGYFARSSNTTAGHIKLKIVNESTNALVAESGSLAVSSLVVWSGDEDDVDYKVCNFGWTNGLTLNQTESYRIEAHCIGCSTDIDQKVVWWSNLSNSVDRYTLGTHMAKPSSSWVPYENDFSFKIQNVNSDGSIYVSRAQSVKEKVYRLNTPTLHAQTFKPELGDDYIVSFPDPALASAVRNKANLNSEDPITYRDALSITSLDASGVTNLEGIDYLENLQTLTLVTNSDLSLAQLVALTKLKSLYLHGKSITNIAPLANLTSLTYLLLSNDQITSIAAVASLTKLTELVIFADKLTGVGALGSIASNLKRLEIESDELTNVASFSTLANVERLKLRAPKVTNISSFTGLRKLIDLKIYASEYNPENPVDRTSELTNISALAGLSTLTSLEIKETKVSNISALSGLINLTELRLSENKISNIGALASLTKLQTLVLNFNQIQTIPQSIASLTQLSDLNLANNQLLTLANLNLLTSLDYLSLYSNVNITQQMVNTLRQQLPNTEIYF